MILQLGWKISFIRGNRFRVFIGIEVFYIVFYRGEIVIESFRKVNEIYVVFMYLRKCLI